MKALSLGVVIPCHDNAWQLSGVLRALAAQTVPPDAVVVVDDNSNPWQRRRLRSLCRTRGARYRKLPAPRSELETLGRRSHARNLGTKCLNTDIVLYLDGDMLPGPGYVDAIKSIHAVLPQVYLRGQRYSLSFTQQAMGMEFCLAASARRQSRDVSSPGYVTCDADVAGPMACEGAVSDRWEWCASNNLSVRREHVVRIHYWDETFLGWGEEDMDFSFRLHRQGLTPLHLVTEAAAAYHLDHPIDHEINRVTLERNGRYFLNKFPAVADYRRDAYARYGINV